jgi:pseudouridine synthase
MKSRSDKPGPKGSGVRGHSSGIRDQGSGAANRNAGNPQSAPTKRVPGNPQSTDSPQSAIRNPQSSERLQKILARAGVASRRAAEEMIAAGRVRVNGQTTTEMGTRADPNTDKIEIDGRPLATPTPKTGDEFVYVILNKPLGVVSTAKDPQGRPTVLDLVRPPDERRRTNDEGRPTTDHRPPTTRDHSAFRTPHSAFERIYPVGRLDADSTGLILLTNDGDLTFRLTHPRFGVEKEYRALVRGKPGAEELKKLREGVEIEGEMTAPARVVELGKRGDHTWLSITIHQGRKRQVRLMCAAVGHPVIELERVRFGPMTLGSLQQGKWRYLAIHEVHALRKAVKLPTPRQ